MSTESVFSLGGWKSRLKSAWDYDPEDRAYVTVLMGLILTMLGFYYLSMGADSYETIMMARLTIYATLFLLMMALANTFFNIGGMITPDTPEEEDDLFDSDTDLKFDLSYGMLARKTGVIVAYFFGVYYIGFFISTAIFTFIYVLLNTDWTGRNRWLRAIMIAVLVVGILWTIFDLGLDMIAIYRLGPYP